MSDDAELERLKARKIQKMQQRLRQQEEEDKVEDEKPLPPRETLKSILVGRAWEVLDAAEVQYPEPTRMLEKELAKLVNQGRLKGPVSAEQLMWLFRRLGMDVRLQTKIQVYESGELKSLEDKFKGR